MRKIPISEPSATHFWTIDYIYLKNTLKYCFRRSIMRGVYLGVLNKLLTHIQHFTRYTKRLLLRTWCSLCWSPISYCRGLGGEDRKKFYKIYLSITKVSQNKSDKHSEVITDVISIMQSCNYIASFRRVEWCGEVSVLLCICP